MKTLILPLIAAAALAGCASTPSLITGGAPTGGIPLSKGTILATDLVSAAYNLDKAVEVGALLPDDPAPKCLHAVLVKAGLETAPGAVTPASFEPKNDGIASLGTIAYIIVQQAKRAVPVQVSPDCEALVGRIAIDGAKAANKAAVSLIPGLIR